MGRVIWKYQIEINDVVSIRMPQRAKILTVQTQYGHPCIWALVDPQMPDAVRLIQIAGTGHDLSKRSLGEYIGAFQIEDGQLVFHAFDAGELKQPKQ